MALDRRKGQPATASCPTCGAPLLEDGRTLFDLEAGIAIAGGHAASFTRQEAAIFARLWAARPGMVPRDRLFVESQRDHGCDERELKIVDVLVCHIRRKLKPLGIEVKTVWGEGYRVVAGGGSNG